MKYTKTQIQEAKIHLLKYDWTKDELIAVVKSVSKSGMCRHIDFSSRKELHWLTPAIATVLGWPWKEDGIVVTGCGMDMVFHTVDCLTHTLFSKEELKEMRDKGLLKGNGGSCIKWNVL
jgi:hypothetical protein